MPWEHMQEVAVYVWLGSLPFLVLAYCTVLIVRSEYSLWENCLFAPTFLMGRMKWRVGFENDPPPEIDSGAVLVANHRSSVDPFFVQLAARRRVHWMVAKEYCQHALFGSILRPLEVIPTNRSGMDTAAMKRAIRFTGEGRLVGMFPEGKINQTDCTLLPIRSGAALVAARSNVPLIPMYIAGSPFNKTPWSPVLMRAKVRISFGTAVSPTDFSLDDNGSSSRGESVDTDAMILECGQQILELACTTQDKASLASARRKRK